MAVIVSVATLAAAFITDVTAKLLPPMPAFLEEAMKQDQTLLLIPQRDILEADPELSGLYPIGTVAKVKQVLKNGGDTQRVLVTGMYRARISEITLLTSSLIPSS